MPATIACPKCQTKYKLPDSALGKPIKCQKCGAGFRTQAPAGQPQPSLQQPSGIASPQPNEKELARYGIEGRLKRQADIFSAPPPPPRANPLGNFVLEDPGFADVEKARREVLEEEGRSDGMEAILSNPYARGGKKGRLKSNLPDIDLKPYAVARVGMWMVFVSWAALLVSSASGCLFIGISILAPEFIPQVFSVLLFGMLNLMSLASGFVFIGQIICIFSPNKDEKVFAGFAIGSLVVAAVLPVIGILIGAAGAVMSGAGATGDAAENDIVAVAGGLTMVLFVIVGPYILNLANMFFHISYFRRVGNNIRSKEVTASANLAMGVWIAATVGAMLGVIAAVLLVTLFSSQGWLNTALIGIVLVIVILGLAAIGTLVAMVKTTLNKTRPS